MKVHKKMASLPSLLVAISFIAVIQTNGNPVFHPMVENEDQKVEPIFSREAEPLAELTTLKPKEKNAKIVEPVNTKPKERSYVPSKLDIARKQLSRLLKDEWKTVMAGEIVSPDMSRKIRILVDEMKRYSFDDCQPLICPISSCWGGFKRDERGCEICECDEIPSGGSPGNAAVDGCPSLSTCRISSCWGDLQYKGRCELCACEGIPPNAKSVLGGIGGVERHRQRPVDRVIAPHPPGWFINSLGTNGHGSGPVQPNGPDVIGLPPWFGNGGRHPNGFGNGGRHPNGCSQITCGMFCPLGFDKNADGCTICKCKQAPPPGPVDRFIVPYPPANVLGRHPKELSL